MMGHKQAELSRGPLPAAKPRPKILLVEDNPANRDMLQRRLNRQGFDVCCAVDGPSGVAMAASEKPDVILMDVALGDMNGWEATRLIKSRPSTAHIPIIALTAHALTSDRDKSITVGCSDFDTKPVDLARLIDKIDTCLALSRVQSKLKLVQSKFQTPKRAEQKT